MSEITKVCRLCLKENFNASELVIASESLKHLISQYFHIQISQDDTNIPNSVCHTCSQQILNFNAFETTVLLNQERLIDDQTSDDSEENDNSAQVPPNLESLVKELELDKEFVEIDTDTFNDKEMAGFAITPENNIVKRVDVQHYPKYSCHICGRQSLNEEDHEIHQYYHQLSQKQYKTFQCEICAKVFEKRYQYLLHLKRHAVDPQACKICKKEFDNQLKLEDHLRICHLPLIFVACDICGQLFKSQKLLNLHNYLKHQQQEAVKCKICNIRLTHHRGLERHNRTVHNPNVKKYKCSTCDKQYMSRRALDVHEARHAVIEARKHQCEYCKERFMDLEDLQEHRVTVHPLEYVLKRQEKFVVNQKLDTGQIIQISF